MTIREYVFLLMNLLVNSLKRKENDRKTSSELKAEAKGLNFYYNTVHALKNISLPIARRKVYSAYRPVRLRKDNILKML